MGSVVEKFGSPVYRRAQVLIPFKHRPFRLPVQLHHAVETRQLRAHHEIRVTAGRLQHVEHHPRDGRLPVRTADHRPSLLGCGVVKELGVRLHRQSQGLRGQQLRVVCAGMHAEDDGIEVAVQSLWKPTFCLGQDPRGGQARPRRFEDGIVGARDRVASIVQRQGQIVHGASADGNEVNPHGTKLSLQHLPCSHEARFDPLLCLRIRNGGVFPTAVHRPHVDQPDGNLPHDLRSGVRVRWGDLFKQLRGDERGGRDCLDAR